MESVSGMQGRAPNYVASPARYAHRIRYCCWTPSPSRARKSSCSSTENPTLLALKYLQTDFERRASGDYLGPKRPVTGPASLPVGPAHRQFSIPGRGCAFLQTIAGEGTGEDAPIAAAGNCSCNLNRPHPVQPLNRERKAINNREFRARRALQEVVTP